METLVSPEIILSLVGGVLVTLLAKLVQKFFSTWDLQYIALGVAVILGGLYMGFKTYIPVEVQEKVLNFVLGSLSFGVVIYEFIWKRLSGDHKIEEQARIAVLGMKK